MTDPVYITKGLLRALLELAADADPEALSVGLDATPAGELDAEADVPADAPVLTHLYLPGTDATSAVFGFDLSRSPGQTAGRFLSHPLGDPGIQKTDDLHARMLIAIPPWDDTSVTAYTRMGRRRRLHVLDVEPPAEALPDDATYSK